MKKDGVFISIGRGVCVDEDALVEALQNKEMKVRKSEIWKMY